MVRLMENVAVALISRPVAIVANNHAVEQPSNCPYDWDRPILLTDHRREPAGFEETGHNDHVRAGIDQMGQVLDESYFQVTVRMIVQVALQLPEVFVYPMFRARV